MSGIPVSQTRLLPRVGFAPVDTTGRPTFLPLLAQILDEVHFDNYFQHRLAEDPRVRLRDLIERLPPQEHRDLENYFGTEHLKELLSLAEEQDAGIFFQGLLRLADRTAKHDLMKAAHQIYSHLEHSGAPLPIKAGARQGRELLEGKGPFGARAELFLRCLAHDAVDYRTA